MPKISPLAPTSFPTIPPIDGVRFASGVANIRYKDRVDLFYAELVEGTTVAGVFARSSMPSAAVDWCRHAMVDGDGHARALVVNSGNANAFTGRQGAEAARGTAEAAARIAGTRSGEVFVSSTGVIGEPLPYERIVAKLPDLKTALGTAKGDEWEAAARAISTTDTFPKGAVRTASIGGVPVTIAGICKGSGMIAPNMGTMLGYVFTDAQISSGLLQHLLTRAADKSFNAITVDSDASTNDTVLAFATGRAKHPWVAAAGDAHFRDFRRKFDEVMLELAHQIVKDGEGATKFVTVTVTGAAGAASAKRHSVLYLFYDRGSVKTPDTEIFSSDSKDCAASPNSVQCCTVLEGSVMSTMFRKGAEEARNQLPDLLEAAEHGRSTIITRHGRPVAALVPVEGYAVRQQPLIPLAGSGRGLWGKNSTEVLRKLRDEWSR